MIATLIFFIALLSLMQGDKRRMTALVFALLTLTHQLAFKEVGGFYYFISTALIDLLIILVIANLKLTTKLTYNLLNVCIGFIVLNAAAWIAWEYWLPYEVIYQSLSAMLYMCAVVSLLNWDGVEDGNYKIDRWVNCFRMYNHKSFFSHNKLQGKG